MLRKIVIFVSVILACAGLIAAIWFFKSDKPISCIPAIGATEQAKSSIAKNSDQTGIDTGHPDNKDLLPAQLNAIPVSESKPSHANAVAPDMPVNMSVPAVPQVRKTPQNQQPVVNALAADVQNAAVSQNKEDVKADMYTEMLTKVENLSDNLGVTNIKELKDILKAKYSEDSGMDIVQYDAIKNNILDRLIAQNESVPELGRFIVEMYNDKSNDALWRDYCVQHFELYYEKKWPNGAPGSDEEARTIRNAYFNAMNEADGSIAATALIGMERLSRVCKEMDRTAINALARKMALNDGASIESRISGVKVCGMIGDQSIRTEAKENISNSDSIPLRLASISTLADLKDKSDIEFLEKTASAATSPYVQAAANMAILRLNDADIKSGRLNR